MEHERAVLESVVETVPDGILVVDDDREFYTYNQQFVDMWGIPDEVVKTKDDQRALESVLDELERPDEFLKTVEYFYDNPMEVGRDTIHLSDGRVFDRYTAPATDSAGTYYGRIWVFRDVTEQKRYEEKLRQQRDRLEDFAQLLSHDLRNPLSVAQGHVELLKQECEDPQYIEHLEDMARAHARIETLIKDVLTLARSGATVDEADWGSLEAISQTCWQNVETENATLTTESDLNIRAKPSRFKQLMENLFRNAVEHGGADVSVYMGHLDDRSGFYVEDDGWGIPAADQEQIFERGYSTAETGTGLGLTIVKQVAQTHGWEVSVTDGSRGGARFEITGVECATA